MHLGIAGNGLAGRVLALRLLELGCQVSLFDARRPGERPAAEVAAGMLSPLAELETGDARIHALGLRSIARWPSLLDGLDEAVDFACRGSLVTCHPGDRAMALRLVERIRHRLAEAGVDDDAVRSLDAEAIRALEPGLAGDGPAWLLAGEAHLDAQAFMRASAARLARDAEVVHGRAVTTLAAGELCFADGTRRRFDHVFDCRGLGARADGLPLRGVRGEVLWLHTDEVVLQRPVRVMHPRYRVYVVPRPGQVFVVGATEIESEDTSPVSVRGMMELASASAVIDPAFLEARIVDARTQLRPALPDNLPRVDGGDGLTRINGLYRHGYLLAPALVDDALARARLAREAA